MTAIDAVLAEMTASYGDLAALARQQVVSAEDIAEALAEADTDSAEYVCLKLLEKNVQRNTEHE
jgi:NACalpha-BTF3-like transcription factor